MIEMVLLAVFSFVIGFCVGWLIKRDEKTGGVNVGGNSEGKGLKNK